MDLLLIYLVQVVEVCRKLQFALCKLKKLTVNTLRICKNIGFTFPMSLLRFTFNELSLPCDNLFAELPLSIVSQYHQIPSSKFMLPD